MSDESDSRPPMDHSRSLVEFLAKSLVDDPDSVDVAEVDDDGVRVFELTVADGDLGKVIGREGRTARAIRTLLSATAAKRQERAVLQILE